MCSSLTIPEAGEVMNKVARELCDYGVCRGWNGGIPGDNGGSDSDPSDSGGSDSDPSDNGGSDSDPSDNGGSDSDPGDNGGSDSDPSDNDTFPMPGVTWGMILGRIGGSRRSGASFS